MFYYFLSCENKNIVWNCDPCQPTHDNYSLLQGAPESILDRCDFVRVGKTKHPLTPKLKDEIMGLVMKYGTGIRDYIMSINQLLVIGDCAGAISALGQ